MSISLEPALLEQALAALRRKGNPFRQQFARNSDDTVCSRFHVSHLFAEERNILADLVESYRNQPDRPTSVLPLLGARGAGKTHLLHWLKHGPSAGPQLFVTPGTFRIDTGGPESSFLEYVLYQLINVLLAGGEQRGARPLGYVGEGLTRRALAEVIARQSEKERLDLLPTSGLKKFGWKLGVGVKGSLAAIEEFRKALLSSTEPCRTLAQQADLDPERLTAAALAFLEQHEPRDLKGEFRRRIIGDFIRATLLGDEADLADFLTDGFTEVPFQVKPSRSQLTLSLLQALSEVIVGVGIPVAVAFDQLEELLYGQSEEEIRRSSDAFFGGIVQLMSQVSGLCVLLFVEEGLWNRIVPPLPSHILDRLHEPIHLPNHGTVRHVRMTKPTVKQLSQVVDCRVRRTLAEYPDVDRLPSGFPFGIDFLSDLTRRETVLRLMLQGCCNRLDEVFESPGQTLREMSAPASPRSAVSVETPSVKIGDAGSSAEDGERDGVWDDLVERWHQEVRVAERKLKPVGSLAGAMAELQGGLARWLQLCKLLGVEQEDWRMTGLQEQTQVGDHPTYGSLTIVEWSNAGGDSQRLGVGLWLGRGVGKPRDLETKLQVFAQPEKIVDHLVLFRPADDIRLSGKTRAAWDQAVEAGHSVRLEPVDLDGFAKIHAFPRWMQQVTDAYSAGRVPERVYVFLAEQTESIILKLGLPAEAKPARKAG